MLQPVRVMLCALLLAPLGALAQEEPAAPAADAPAADAPPADAPPADAPPADAPPADAAAPEEAPAAEADVLKGSHIEAFYTPSATLTLASPGSITPSSHEDGTGATVRGLYRFRHWLAFTGEYSQDKFSDANIDLKQGRAGVGLTLDNPAGDLIGMFAEYDHVDSDLDKLDGYSGHLRIAREPENDLVHFYADLGYLMLKGDLEDTKGFEFDAGVVFDLGRWGVLVDYRRTALSGKVSHTDVDLGVARVGARFEF